MNRYNAALAGKNYSRPPVWFMRQAGRYHEHYQRLRAKNSFMDLCKKPELACEVTFGPLDDFGFDAAILFSDLLFPLEAMGMGLEYSEGPKLGWHLREIKDLSRLKGGGALAQELEFQAEALRLIRKRLPNEKGLLGFVGGPLTLFCYAVEGSHAGHLPSAREGLMDGRFQGFFEKLVDLLAQNMALQAQAGADAVAMFDTCAGEFDAQTYARVVVPAIRDVLAKFKALCPATPVVYYSRGTGPEHWAALKGVQPIQCLGVDWRHDLASVLEKWTGDWTIQGNIDPDWLFLSPAELESRLRVVFSRVLALSSEIRARWVCGLGHGVLPKTPEENVRLFLRVQKEMFDDSSRS